MKGRHVDDIVEPASRRLQGRLEIGEGQTNLSLEVRLRRTIAAAADLPGHEQQITGPDRRGIGVGRIEVLPTGGKTASR